MSTDYHFYCDNCKKIDPEIFASGSIAYGFKIWRGEDLNRVQAFLEEHEGHKIELICDGHPAFDEPDWWTK